MKTKKIEIYRCWSGNSGDGGQWDTEVIAIPVDTPEEKYQQAIDKYVASPGYKGGPDRGLIIAAGFYSEVDEEKEEYVCPHSDDGKHVPDYASVSFDSRMDPPGVVDISCKKCGLSGSFIVPVDDINW